MEVVSIVTILNGDYKLSIFQLDGCSMTYITVHYIFNITTKYTTNFSALTTLQESALNPSLPPSNNESSPRISLIRKFLLKIADNRRRAIEEQINTLIP